MRFFKDNIYFAISAVFVALAIARFVYRQRSIRRWTRSKGRIVGRENRPSSGEGAATFAAVFEFTDPGTRQTVRVTNPVGSTTFPYTMGEEIEITSPPNQPQKAVIADTVSLHFASIFLAVAAFIAFLAGMISGSRHP